MDMQTVSVSRVIPADPAVVSDRMADVEPFMQAGGFSEASADDEGIYLRQNLGLGRIELRLDLVDDPEAELAYEQREGIFEEMDTRYTLRAVDGGTEVTATTTFALGGVVGSVLDATIVKRKRRSELNAQFDYLEAAVGSD
ncbi:MAG: SRPBCC family protein [Halobacteriales archaeon]|nr:SRPBCC family protein [Halobacteriales archaeon]